MSDAGIAFVALIVALVIIVSSIIACYIIVRIVLRRLYGEGSVMLRILS